MFKRIIVGVDGSPASLNASRLAFRLGNFYGVPVVGIYVIDVRLLEESFLADLAGVLGFTYYEGVSGKVKEFLEKQGDAVLSEFSSLGREFGAKVSVVQTTGIPHREIVGQADPEDLIVVGKRGKRPVKGVLLGSNSEKVARSSPCPVVLVPEEDREIKRVMVAYDGSENSRLALKICRSMKGVFGYEVVVLHVKEGDENAVEVKAEIDGILGEGYEFLEMVGLPEERIVEASKELGIDMLFMGAYGKGRFRELFLGSVTSFLIHHLEIPMLLAKVPKG